MIKKNSWIVALLLALSFTAFFTVSCVDPYVPPPPSGGDTGPFEFTGPWDGIIKPWGNNAPTVSGNQVSITASQSTGFYINFADIGYTLSSQKLKFYYKVEVTTPAVVITAKYKDGDSLEDLKFTDYGKGKGREYQLDSATRGNVTGGLVDSSYNDTTKEGWFEVYMAGVPSGKTAIGFQHNAWADTDGDGVKIAESSEYKLTITKIEKVTGDIEVPVTPPLETGVIFNLEDWIEDNDDFGDPLVKSGSAEIEVDQTSKKLTVTVANNWDGIDLKFEKFNLDPAAYKIKVEIEGNIVTLNQDVVDFDNRGGQMKIQTNPGYGTGATSASGLDAGDAFTLSIAEIPADVTYDVLRILSQAAYAPNSGDADNAIHDKVYVTKFEITKIVITNLGERE